jgi:hypothetical protein
VKKSSAKFNGSPIDVTVSPENPFEIQKPRASVDKESRRPPSSSGTPRSVPTSSSHSAAPRGTAPTSSSSPSSSPIGGAPSPVTSKKPPSVPTPGPGPRDKVSVKARELEERSVQLERNEADDFAALPLTPEEEAVLLSILEDRSPGLGDPGSDDAVALILAVLDVLRPLSEVNRVAALLDKNRPLFAAFRTTLSREPSSPSAGRVLSRALNTIMHARPMGFVKSCLQEPVIIRLCLNGLPSDESRSLLFSTAHLCSERSAGGFDGCGPAELSRRRDLVASVVTTALSWGSELRDPTSPPAREAIATILEFLRYLIVVDSVGSDSSPRLSKLVEALATTRPGAEFIAKAKAAADPRITRLLFTVARDLATLVSLTSLPTVSSPPGASRSAQIKCLSDLFFSAFSVADAASQCRLAADVYISALIKGLAVGKVSEDDRLTMHLGEIGRLIFNVDADPSSVVARAALARLVKRLGYSSAPEPSTPSVASVIRPTPEDIEANIEAVTRSLEFDAETLRVQMDHRPVSSAETALVLSRADQLSRSAPAATTIIPVASRAPRPATIRATDDAYLLHGFKKLFRL